MYVLTLVVPNNWPTFLIRLDRKLGQRSDKSHLGTSCLDTISSVRSWRKCRVTDLALQKHLATLSSNDKHNGIFISFKEMWQLKHILANSMKWSSNRDWLQLQVLMSSRSFPCGTNQTTAAATNIVPHASSPITLLEGGINLLLSKVSSKPSTLTLQLRAHLPDRKHCTNEMCYFMGYVMPLGRYGTILKMAYCCVC